MRTALLLCLVGCNSDLSPGPVDYDCLSLAKTVKQEHGTCRVAIRPTDRVDLPLYGGCVSAQDAYCGNEVDCPSDWSIHCENGTATPINCMYGTGKCYAPENGTVTFDYYQMLDEQQGIAIVQKDGQCEFHACEPLR